MPKYRVCWDQLAPDLYAGKQENGLYTGRLHDAAGAEIKKRTALPSQEAVHEWAAKERAKRAAPPPGVLYTAPEVSASAESTAIAPPAATTRERVLVRNAAGLVIGCLDPQLDGTWRASAGNGAHTASGLVREAAETWVHRVYEQTYASVVYPLVLDELTAADIDRAEDRGEAHVLAEWVRRLMAGGEWGKVLREDMFQRMLGDEDLRAEVIEKLEDDKEIRDEVKEKLAEDADLREAARDFMLSEDEALADEVRRELREDLRQDVLDDLRTEARAAMAADLAATDSKGAWVAAAALLPEDVAQAVSEALARRREEDRR